MPLDYISRSRTWLMSSAILIALALIVLISGQLIVHEIIALAYKGESLPFLNRLISGRAQHSLAEYHETYDVFAQHLALLLGFVSLIPLLVSVLPARYSRLLLPFALTLGPFVYLIYFITKYSIDLPTDDSWFLLPLLEKSGAGNLGLADLWEPLNEHRMFVPKAVMFLIAYLSDWNVLYESFFNAFLMVVIFLALSLPLAKLWLHNGKFDIVDSWPFPLISVLVFSFGQWENFFLPMQWFFVSALAIVGFFFLAHSLRVGSYFIGSVVVGLLITFTSAHGLLYWPIGLLVIIAHGFGGQRATIRMAGIWTAVAAFSVFGYFYGMSSSASRGAIHILVESPLLISQYVLTFIGGGIVRSERLALVVGAVGVLAYIAIGVRMALERRDIFVNALQYFAVGGFAIGAGVLTAMGRLEHYGLSNAIYSRYVTLSLLFWVSLLCIMYLFLKMRKYGDVDGSNGWARYEYGIVGVSVVVAFFSLYSSITHSIPEALWNQQRFLGSTRDHVMSVPNEMWQDDVVIRLYPLSNPGEMKEMLAKIKLLGLAAFNSETRHKYQPPQE